MKIAVKRGKPGNLDRGDKGDRLLFLIHKRRKK
jgi:hypothetical protein